MARPTVADQLIEEAESLHLNARGYPASSFQEALATVIDMAQPETLEEKALTVDTAYPDDSGLNLVRVHPLTLDQLSIGQGHPIEIVGDRTTVAMAREMEGGAAHRGAARVDGFTRENAGIDTGETVIVRPTTVEPAERVALEYSADNEPRLGEKPAEHVRDQVEGRIVSDGDTVPVAGPADTPSGTPGKAVPLAVAEIDADHSYVRIDPETEIELVGK